MRDAQQIEFFSRDNMVCASPPKLRGRRISELHPSLLPKVKKPPKVKPWLQPIDLPIHHGDGNLTTFVLNFTTDVVATETEEEEEVEKEGFMNVTQPTQEAAPEMTSQVVPDKTVPDKTRGKNAMPDANNQILKNTDRRGNAKQTHRKIGYFSDQQNKEQIKEQQTRRGKTPKDPFDGKTRSRGRHRIVESDGSSGNQAGDQRTSKATLFAQLLSRETSHVTRDYVDGSGSSEEEEPLRTRARPGLFYDAYLKKSSVENSGETDNSES